MNRTQGRPPVRLIQLQSARSAPKQAPDFAPGTVACSTFTTTPPPTIPTKAGKGIRTLDIQLGKLTLYQLSYARITVDSLSIQPDASLHNPGPSRQVRARPRDTRPDPM